VDSLLVRGINSQCTDWNVSLCYLCPQWCSESIFSSFSTLLCSQCKYYT